MSENTETPARVYTYGDILELPGLPGILWLVKDRRDPNNPTEAAADLEPVHPADETHPEPYTYRYDEMIKIGRAERPGVSIELRAGKWVGEDHDPAGLSVWPRCNRYNSDLTQAQMATLTTAAESVVFDLPGMTPDQIRAKYFDSVRVAAEWAGKLTDRRILTDTYGGTKLDPAVAKAVDAAARLKAVEIAVETFRAEVTQHIHR